MVNRHDSAFLTAEKSMMGHYSQQNFLNYSGNPLIRSPIGQKKLAVLTGDRINEGFFYKKMYGRFAWRPKNVVIITRWPGVPLY